MQLHCGIGTGKNKLWYKDLKAIIKTTHMFINKNMLDRYNRMFFESVHDSPGLGGYQWRIMANYGELWRRFLWRIGPNSTAQFAIIRHNSPNFLQIYYRLGIFLLYRQAFLASIQVFNLFANAISR